MTTVSDDVMQYPFVEDDGLEVDAYFRELQRRPPVRIQMRYGPPCWLATRYDDVRTIFCDRRFSRVLRPGVRVPGAKLAGELLDTTFPLGMDPPQHTRVRRITAPVFSPKSIRSMRDRIQGLVDGLVDRMIERGPGVDFSAEFAWELPIRALTLLLGVPDDDADAFRVWVETTSSELEPDDVRAAAHSQTIQYIEGLIAARRARRHDDLVAMLVDACDEGDRLTEGELRGLIMSLIGGGFETTATQLGSSVYALMTHPEHWQELVDGRVELSTALDELWRWIPGFRYGTMFVRWAHEDVELGNGFVIRAGEAILPEQPVANRDEAAFPHGWELDFHRADPRTHLALGFGEHLCMGIHLAKLQVELTIAALVRQFPGLQLAIPPHEVEWPKWMFMRTVGALPLTW